MSRAVPSTTAAEAAALCSTAEAASVCSTAEAAALLSTAEAAALLSTAEAAAVSSTADAAASSVVIELSPVVLPAGSVARATTISVYGLDALPRGACACGLGSVFLAPSYVGGCRVSGIHPRVSDGPRHRAVRVCVTWSSRDVHGRGRVACAAGRRFPADPTTAAGARGGRGGGLSSAARTGVIPRTGDGTEKAGVGRGGVCGCHCTGRHSVRVCVVRGGTCERARVCAIVCACVGGVLCVCVHLIVGLCLRAFCGWGVACALVPVFLFCVCVSTGCAVVFMMLSMSRRCFISLCD